MPTTNYLHSFSKDISKIELPKKFTFPFYYETHVLCEMAAKQVQDYITNQKEWIHPFTENNSLNEKPIGKMFGVLVVKNLQGEFGFISAFSGKLAGTNNHTYFVPPVFDMLTNNSHFLKEEIILNDINAQIDALENNADYILQKNNLELLTKTASKEVSDLRAFMIEAKKVRKQERIKAEKKNNRTRICYSFKRIG